MTKQALRDDEAHRIALHLLDRLFQDLMPELLPILKSRCRFSVQINSDEQRTESKPISFSVTKHVN